MNKEELRDLVVSVLVLGVAFSIGQWDQGIDVFLIGFLTSLFIIGVAFVFHELAHRTVARRFGAFAKYKMNPIGLFMAILFAVITGGRIIFAAPGAVYITALSVARWKERFVTLRAEEYGIISLAGPLANIALAAIFLAINHFAPFAILITAAYINLILAAFNLLPFPPLDGSKVIGWSRKVWLIAFLTAVISWIGLGF